MSDPSPRERSYNPEDGSAPFFQDLCNWNRFEEIEESGVETVAAACPFCNVMFEDAAKYVGNDKIKIKDIAELLEDSLDLPVKNSNFEKLTSEKGDKEEINKNDDTSQV